MVKLTGNYMKLSIRGKMENCENCAIGKMRQKNIKKRTKRKTSKPGFRFYIDIALSKFTSAGGSKYWFLAVDEATRMKFSLLETEKWCQGKVYSVFEGITRYVWKTCRTY